jgi:hypothetical protein
MMECVLVRAAVIRPASMQKAVWSFLYTTAAGMFSEEQLPHFVHLVKHTAFLLPDPTARIHLLVLSAHHRTRTRTTAHARAPPHTHRCTHGRHTLTMMDGQEALDSGGDEQIKSKEEGLVWLWELHQQVNRNIPDPFVFVEPGLSSGLTAVELAQLLKVNSLPLLFSCCISCRVACRWSLVVSCRVACRVAWADWTACRTYGHSRSSSWARRRSCARRRGVVKSCLHSWRRRSLTRHASRPHKYTCKASVVSCRVVSC